MLQSKKYHIPGFVNLPKSVELSTTVDTEGFQSVGEQLPDKVTDRQFAEVKKALGTKTIDRGKIQQVYDFLKNGYTTSEVARMGIYQQRRIAAIKATLLPSKNR